MKSFFAVLVLLLITSTLFAQPRIYLGITTGFNSTYVLDKGLESNPNYIAQANYEWFPIGGSVGIDITNGFGFQFESIRAAQGQVYQMVQTVESVKKMVAERNIDLHYVQFPLLLKFMGTGVKPVRFNFQMGPQLSLLRSGMETIRFTDDASIDLDGDGEIPADITRVLVSNPDDIPQAYQDAVANGEVSPGENELEVPLQYFENQENPGQYDLPQDAVMTLMNSQSENEIQQFKDKELQLAFGFGVDIDLLKYFYLSTNIRANYSFTDMRNQDLIDMIGDEDLTGIFSNRANLLVGVQIGLHWMIGGNRSFRNKGEKHGRKKS